jgi:glucokinase
MPSTPRGVASAARFVIGVDLGGTNIVVGAVSEDGQVRLPPRTEPTDALSGAEAVADRIASVVDAVIADARTQAGVERSALLGIGIGAPGPIDRERGVVVVAPNLRWQNFPLRDEISKRTGLPASLDNDANCATFGEWWLGAGRGSRNMIGLTIGTGIGGGLILDGKLYHGASDVACEAGHMTLETQGRRCSCGNYGCLEAYASGTAIAERAREALGSDGPSALRSLGGGDPAAITARDVYDAAKDGDAIAIEVVRDAAKFLGAGVANLLNIFNPEVVVLAGGVTHAGDALFEPVRAEARRRAFRPAWDAVRILPGELSGDAGVIGAAATFLKRDETG